MNINNLDRFLKAQESAYQITCYELKAGKKLTHWMWYIFPQLKGLGRSHFSNYYGIQDLAEARVYLEHPLLGKRLLDCCRILLKLEEPNAHKIFGSPDHLKLQSCLSLFASLPGSNPVFLELLEKFYAGSRCERTENLLGISLEKNEDKA